MNFEATIMELIINAGESKSCAMQALACAKKGEWDKIDSLLEQSSEAAKQAHKVQTEFIGMDEGSGKLAINLIMVHAQDHIMTAMLARELIEELIDIHHQLHQLQNR
ncbi:PTS lactose/cellobiose transporter subunit IIA [Acerihabitans sp. TG2]|uniref:PTS lactose/cellobiose transporter subunit IIA n=1 Tax=Acerihabitans sp. TG2 TaxID=3096008 RepID=UPI002B223A44|nr:PTS lactose/cellobiose transporter subunit IIA [Acerihabitans sp. TG2]MEA9390241.1 PTS lactose/cellobiose transporter subunit IIA [Acerihabitans sp. TG2]